VLALLQRLSKPREAAPDHDAMPLGCGSRTRLLLTPFVSDFPRMRFSFARRVPNANRLPRRRGEFFGRGPQLVWGRSPRPAGREAHLRRRVRVRRASVHCAFRTTSADEYSAIQKQQSLSYRFRVSPPGSFSGKKSCRALPCDCQNYAQSDRKSISP
jgi:hypothetical protein